MNIFKHWSAIFAMRVGSIFICVALRDVLQTGYVRLSGEATSPDGLLDPSTCRKIITLM